MSLYGAMFSGVSGLNANSQALGAIADNITNVNTIGYKATEVRFQTLVTAQAALNNYSPGGVQQRPFQAVNVQGLFQGSASTTDIGLSGGGFFVVNEASTRTTSTDVTGFNFTRAGAFNADKSGFLRNTAGKYLQGYRTDANGNTVKSGGTVFSPDPTVFDNLETIRLNNIGGKADATTQLTFGANLPATDSIGATNNTTIQVYDSLGNAHNMALVWTKQENNKWDLSIEPPSNGASAIISGSSGVYASVGRLDFTTLPSESDSITVTLQGSATTFEFSSDATLANTANTLVSIESGSIPNTVVKLLAALNTADAVGTSTARFATNSSDSARIDITQYLTAAADASSTDITFDASGTSILSQTGAGLVTITQLATLPTATAAVDFNGTGVPSAFNISTVSMDVNNGADDLGVTLNLGTVNQADGLTQFASAYSPSFIDTDGSAFGQFAGVTIGEDGIVTALFENGDLRKIYRIPVATFPNANGLGAKTGNVYSQTDFSGLFFLRQAGLGGAGTVQSAVLESSTVDIAKEFTNMITTQRAYSAAAKIISTADQMLDELVRIKR